MSSKKGKRQSSDLNAEANQSMLDPLLEMKLVETNGRLELTFPLRGGPAPLAVDFVNGAHGYARRRNRFGLLYQAVGFPRERPSVVDATAGLGADAFRLAYRGCSVIAIERSPLLHSLLQDGLNRAEQDEEIRRHLNGRLKLLHADARDFLRDCKDATSPEVVFLDPMYPPKKNSALPKIEMRILRRIVGDDLDATELFEIARAVARNRVVVKRHRDAHPIADAPSYSLCDTSTRYDVYLRNPPV